MARKNYFSEEEQRLMKKMYKSDEKRENPKSLEGMMMGFHGRSLKAEEKHDYSEKYASPQQGRAVGIAKKVYYDSDKRDPASPYGEGKQGIMKRFVHDHDKGEVLLYELTSRKSIRPTLPAKVVNHLLQCDEQYMCPRNWADVCGYIGKLVSVEYENQNGLVSETFEDFDLYVWDDMKTLMAVPSSGLMYQVLIWRGPDLKVNWRGIIH
jgi:hypothetical protein